MVFEKVGNWLKKMDLTFAYNEEKRAYVLPYNIEGNKFLLAIMVFPEQWIKIVSLIVDKSKVSKDMYLTLLQENWKLFEVTYSVDEFGNIFSENDLPHTTNYENFVSEFQAVVFGVKHFFETVAPRVGVKAEGTYEKNRSMWV